jgi:hypothetical protein
MPGKSFGNAVPYFFDDAALERAVAGLGAGTDGRLA